MTRLKRYRDDGKADVDQQAPQRANEHEDGNAGAEAQAPIHREISRLAKHHGGKHPYQVRLPGNANQKKKASSDTLIEVPNTLDLQLMRNAIDLEDGRLDGEIIDYLSSGRILSLLSFEAKLLPREDRTNRQGKNKLFDAPWMMNELEAFVAESQDKGEDAVDRLAALATFSPKDLEQQAGLSVTEKNCARIVRKICNACPFEVPAPSACQPLSAEQVVRAAAATLITAFLDVRHQPVGFYHILLTGDLAKPMRSAVRVKYESLYRFPSRRNDAVKGTNKFTNSDSRALPWPNKPVDNFEEFPASEPELLAFFKVLREAVRHFKIKSAPQDEFEARIDWNDVAAILPGRNAEDCLYLYRLHLDVCQFEAATDSELEDVENRIEPSPKRVRHTEDDEAALAEEPAIPQISRKSNPKSMTRGLAALRQNDEYDMENEDLTEDQPTYDDESDDRQIPAHLQVDSPGDVSPHPDQVASSPLRQSPPPPHSPAPLDAPSPTHSAEAVEDAVPPPAYDQSDENRASSHLAQPGIHEGFDSADAPPRSVSKSNLLVNMSDDGAESFNLQPKLVLQLRQDQEVISSLRAQLAEQKAHSAAKDEQLAKSKKQLAEKATQLTEKDKQLVKKDMQLVEKDTQLAEKDMQLAEKDEFFALLEKDCTNVERACKKIKQDFRVAQWRLKTLQDEGQRDYVKNAVVPGGPNRKRAWEK